MDAKCKKVTDLHNYKDGNINNTLIQHETSCTLNTIQQGKISWLKGKMQSDPLNQNEKNCQYVSREPNKEGNTIINLYNAEYAITDDRKTL